MKLIIEVIFYLNNILQHICFNDCEDTNKI